MQSVRNIYIPSLFDCHRLGPQHTIRTHTVFAIYRNISVHSAAAPSMILSIFQDVECGTKLCVYYNNTIITLSSIILRWLMVEANKFFPGMNIWWEPSCRQQSRLMRTNKWLTEKLRWKMDETWWHSFRLDVTVDWNIFWANIARLSIYEAGVWRCGNVKLFHK